ncbi:MAG: type I DNA topoisomerase [Acidobacteriota bacterium]|jgi:DNA topoisomerase-1
MGKSLVIVESPAKARTINRYLGDAYNVKASMGHVRDLPKKGLSVDIEKGFTPTYAPIEDKKKVIKDLRLAAKQADAIYIATDPDREGEAIGWHLVELLPTDGKPVVRVLMEEITKDGIKHAFDHPGEIDINKVEAQQARRILDRIVGYKLSPLLWDKVRRGISAGRVQSVALRLIVDREREIEAFVPEEYWSIKAHMEGDEPPTFEAELQRKDGDKLAIGNQDEALALLADLGVADAKIELDDENNIVALSSSGVDWPVTKVEAKKRKRRPKPPFTTSQLQQAAARRMRFAVRKTMRVAQQLYEGVEIGDEGSVGLITYMRTDSTRVSEQSQAEAKEVITSRFGADFALAKPRTFKAGKRAQEAHEAIRPTSASRTPEELKKYLDKDQFRLYELIWQRFMASQMKDAIYDATSVDIEVNGTDSSANYLFRATGSVLKFPGFLAAYGDVEGDSESPKEDSRLLPPLKEGQALTCLELRPRQHFTQPPPRYSEASLVRELERNGIGRPSTYADILSKLRNREYVTVEERRFKPTELGTVVVDLLVESFKRIMDIDYTARVEDRLDLIESGEENWAEALERFWKRFTEELETAQAEMRDVKREEIETDEVCEKCGKPMVIKWGRFGRFLACTGYPECKNTKQLAKNGEVAETVEPEPTGEDCPKCGKPLVRRSGRFGPFVGCSGFPDCRYIQPKTTGVKCPQCGKGELVEKRTRKGRTFFGCDQYPDCDFATWKPPLPIKCPECGHPFLELRRRKGQPDKMGCPNKECDYVTEAAEKVETG